MFHCITACPEFRGAGNFLIFSFQISLIKPALISNNFILGKKTEEMLPSLSSCITLALTDQYRMYDSSVLLI